ncbi:MAG: Mur ligase domain-containing protein [Kiritimatiellia bacterium]
MPKRIHFMGVGGVGMAGLAYLLKRKGFAVTGCDKYATARTRWLAAEGVPVSVGHDPAHLADADELVVTPAVPADAPECLEARRRNLPVRARGEVLADLVNGTFGIAVCGTHGKTTTSTFTANLLNLLGRPVAWCIGGETGDMPVAGQPARADALVVEADESDGTLARYRARILVVTQIDYDHPEHFPTVESYRACYRTAMDQAETVIRAWELDTAAWPELERLVLGRHNVLNARAAVEVALRLGFTREAISAVLPRALSARPDRRFETVVRTPNVQVVTDYAHHPAELACAIEMAAALKPKRLRVLFQPHRHTRTRRLCAEFPPAFAAADEVVLIPVYAAFEQPVPGGDIADLYAAFRSGMRRNVLLARSAAEAWRHVRLTSRPGDLVLLAGAGDIIQLVPRIRADLARGDCPPDGVCPPSVDLSGLSFFRTGGRAFGGGAPCIVGMGSNTWFSDCATDDEIVRPDLPAGASLGIPWMAGIPGTIGGWAKMNAGAFGHSFSEVVEAVVVDGVRREAKDCAFAYRHSNIDGVVTDVIFNAAALAAARNDPGDYARRRRIFPPRTCGSVFRNPSPERPAGKLLEEAGAKAMRVGGAVVWENHANVIVATDGCTSSDILALARLMARAVFFRTGIRLEPEIRGLDIWS